MAAVDLDHLAELIATSPHNLVGKADREAVRSLHIREAEALAGLLMPSSGSRWMDLGTGGGLPGLVLAQAHPQASWHLVDATRKKAAEVRRFAAELDIACTVSAERAETLGGTAQHRGAYEGLVARAVAPLPGLVELARPFLGHDARAYAVKGERWRAEVDEAAAALDAVAMELEDVASLPRGVVLVLRAIGPVPGWVPRPMGQAQHQPV